MLARAQLEYLHSGLSVGASLSLLNNTAAWSQVNKAEVHDIFLTEPRKSHAVISICIYWLSQRLSRFKGRGQRPYCLIEGLSKPHCQGHRQRIYVEHIEWDILLRPLWEVQFTTSGSQCKMYFLLCFMVKKKKV